MRRHTAAAGRIGVWCALLIVLAMAAAGLGACASGSVGSFFSGSDSGSGSEPETMAPVTFAPVIGAPPEVSEALSSQVATAARRNKIPVADNSDMATYTVRGYLATSNDSKSEKLAYIWDVTDGSGKRVHRILGEHNLKGEAGGDPWAAVDEGALKKIARKTAEDLAEWLPGQAVAGRTGSMARQASTDSENGARRSAAAQPGSGKVQALVAPVSGAPGDGEQSLTKALRKKLDAKGVALASGRSSGVYSVQGKVSMGQPSDGRQSIKIDWVVSDPNGKRLGTVSQQNKVPEGALDGSWGSIADAAAAAAADGIIKLLPESRS